MAALAVVLGGCPEGARRLPPGFPISDASTVRDAQTTTDGSTTPSDAGTMSADSFDPGAIYLLGVVPSIPACNARAVEDFDVATPFAMGFACGTGDILPTISPKDHRLYYYDYNGGTPVIRRFVVDATATEDISTYPTNARSNDPIAATPNCDPDLFQSFESFQIEPVTGEIVIECMDCSAPVGNCSRVFHYQNGDAYPVPSSISRAWLGVGGHSLVFGNIGNIYELRVALGTSSTTVWSAVVGSGIAPNSDQPPVAVRARADGFRVLKIVSGFYTLFQVDFDGEATRVGSYPAPGAGFDSLTSAFTPSPVCRLDDADQLTCISRRYPEQTGVVLRFSIGGSAPQVLYDEASNPVQIDSDRRVLIGAP